MCQRNVEWVVGRLACDEAARMRFAQDRVAFLDELVGRGLTLTQVERRALLSTDCAALESFALRLDPRIQKIDLARACQPVETEGPA